MVFMKTKSNITVATPGNELEEGQDRELEDSVDLDETFTRLLTRLKVEIIREQWLSRHHEQVTNLVLSQLRRTPEIKSGMHISSQGVQLDVFPAHKDITLRSEVTIFEMAFAPAVSPVRKKVKRLHWPWEFDHSNS